MTDVHQISPAVGFLRYNEMNSSTDGQTLNELVATQEMCHYCFDVLLGKLLRGQYGLPSMSVESALNQKLGISDEIECPLFVTWEKRRSSSFLSPLSSSSGITTPSSSNVASSVHNICDEEDSQYELRGCIGTLSPRQLVTALSEFAIASAFRDRRFDPISLHEVRELKIGVSLLVKMEQCANCFDWIVGTHGIIIRFYAGKKAKVSDDEYSATFLPEVAKDQGWTKEETVVSLVRKAGYRGSISNEFFEQIHCTRYQSSKHQTSYHEYVTTRWDGVDPLSSVDPRMTKAAIIEALRQNEKKRKGCVNI